MRPTPREQVLRLLSVEPAGLRAPEPARLVRPRISQPTLWRLLDSLRSEGRVTVEGRGRATRYHSASRNDAAALHKDSPFTILVTPEERRRVFESVRAA